MQSLFKKKKIIKEESNKSKQLREHADNRQEEGGKCRKQAKHPRQVAALVPARKKRDLDGCVWENRCFQLSETTSINDFFSMLEVFVCACKNEQLRD